MEAILVDVLFHGVVIRSRGCVAVNVSGGWTLFFDPPMIFPHEGLYTFNCPDGRAGEFYVHGAASTTRESVLLAGEQLG
jgi:hypothetical protein